MDYQDMTLGQLFAEADRIGNKYQTGGDDMNEQRTAISFYTCGLKKLIYSRGERLLELSAAEKFQLLSFIGYWQSEDTILQESDGECVPLAEAIEDFHYELSGDVLECLGHLKGASDDDVLALMIAIVQQLKEGAFLS